MNDRTQDNVTIFFNTVYKAPLYSYSDKTDFKRSFSLLDHRIKCHTAVAVERITTKYINHVGFAC